MGVQPPKEEEVEMVLRDLDDDFDGSIDKKEFCKLAM